MEKISLIVLDSKYFQPQMMNTTAGVGNTRCETGSGEVKAGVLLFCD